MPSTRELTDEDRTRAAREIDNFFEFTRDVLDDPTILEKIPSGAAVEAIPKDERAAGETYDIETAHMVATVTPRRRLGVVGHRLRKTGHDLGRAIANRKPRRVAAERQRS